MKKLLLFLPFLAFLVLAGADCPSPTDPDHYRLTFINSDINSSSLDAFAIPGGTVVAADRQYGEVTSENDEVSLPVDQTMVRVNHQGTTNTIGDFPLGSAATVNQNIEMVFLGMASTPHFIVKEKPFVVSGSPVEDYQFHVLNAARTGMVDIYVTLRGDGLTAPDVTLNYGEWHSFDANEIKRVRATPAGNPATILADVEVSQNQTLILEPDATTGGAPFTFSIHR